MSYPAIKLNDSFLGLKDTPSAYSSAGGMLVSVLDTEQGLHFILNTDNHQYIVDIPTPVTPIVVGDVLSFYEGSWKKAMTSEDNKTAQGMVIKIDGSAYTLIRFGELILPAHGYDLNTWYYLDIDGTYTKTKPDVIEQLIFFVYDIDTIHVHVERPIIPAITDVGYADVGELGNVGWTFPVPTASVWTKLPFEHPQISTEENFRFDTATQRLMVDFNEAPGTEILCNITISMSVNLGTAAAVRHLYVAHGIDGAVHANSGWQYNFLATASVDAGVMTPITYNWTGLIQNGKGIEIYIKSNVVGEIAGIGRVLSVNGSINV